MSLSDAVRRARAIEGWDWSNSRSRMGNFGWSYDELLQRYATSDRRVLDVGTGGGEVFSKVAKQGDAALDLSLERLAVARRRLPCALVAGDQFALPFVDEAFDVVVERHVGAAAPEVLRVL